MNELERAMRTMLEQENIRTLYAERAYQNVITYFERRVMVRRIVEDRKQLIDERVKKVYVEPYVVDRRRRIDS